MLKRAFTLIELLVVIAIIAILAAILFPVFAQAKDAAKQTACISNTKQTCLAGIMYAADFNDVLPRHDNNGSCWYGENPCDYPDWGDFKLPVGGVTAGEQVMYFGAISPYHKNTQISICPKLGETTWSIVFANAATIGIAPPQGGYNPAHHRYYYNTMGQMAINILMIDYGPQLSATNARPGAPRGNLTAVARPGQVVLFVAESAWDWDPSIGVNLGNGGVWPSWPLNSLCWSATAEGWSRYAHKGKSGVYPYFGNANRVTDNPQMQGWAVYAYTDGHAKAMKYLESEKCVPTPPGTTWNRGVTGNIQHTFYYPNWVPDI